MSQNGTPPRWDMEVVYPGLESAGFRQDIDTAIASIEELEKQFDAYGIERRPGTETSNEDLAAFDDIVERLNTILESTGTLFAYIYAFVATNSKDKVAQATLSELQMKTLKLNMLGTRLTAWIGSLDVDRLLEQSESAKAHAYMVKKAREAAEHLMDPELEVLAQELRLTGSTAWSKLHGDVSSQLLVEVELDGEKQNLPMSEIRNLAFDPRSEVRQTAFEAELAAWEANEVPLAAAMNSIKGEVGLISRRRKWERPLDVAIFDNNIDRKSLEAMMQAAEESFPDFRRYLRAKARALGNEKLPWYDLFAPVGEAGGEWPYSRAQEFIVEQFATYSDRLAGLAQRAFDESWIDAEPRPGKRDGAFCMRLRGEESRILSNYKPVYSQMHTLAHELGHAYHNLNLAVHRPLQRETPMVLAETASIFCQTIIQQSVLEDAEREEQIAILEEGLQDGCQVVVDITSRYLFENRVFGGRTERELSADEFKELMLEAQQETYGDGLDPDVLHPYMWAVKGHYYSAGRSFYNFPYMFGYLFGLGLYAQYEQDQEQFRKGYDDLLSSTGLGDAATLASQFGIDIRSADFWRSSLDIVRTDIDRFESLVDES